MLAFKQGPKNEGIDDADIFGGEKHPRKKTVGAKALG